MEENNNVQFPAPLSVGFYGWNDLSCPRLKYTKFLAIKWDSSLKDKSDVWSDPDISNIIFAGTKKGVILAYKITSNGNQLKNIEPLCFLFGHSLPITSLVKCKQSLYDLCVASLSSDGTISLISVIDLTIIKNSVRLFSENSQDLSLHQTNMRLAIASQTFGTIEIADIYDEKILMRIEGFSSTIYTLISYGSLSAVACIDGSASVFSFTSKTIECLYSFKRNENPPCFSIFSPHFIFLLVISPKQWSLHISDSSLHTEELRETEDSYSNGGWVNDSIFYLQTSEGRFEMWTIPQLDNADEISVVENLKISQSFFTVQTKETADIIKTLMANKKMTADDESSLKSKVKQPKLVFQCDRVIGPIAVTQEGFIISSSSFEPTKETRMNSDSNLRVRSVVFCRDTLGGMACSDLSEIYKSDVICRCAVGDPISSEARIMKDYTIWVNDRQIGKHEGAKMLFSPGQSSAFFTFSRDGSVKAFSEEQFITSFYDLSEPISHLQYVDERDWIIVIGKHSSFSVISTRSMQSVALCTGHNSPVIQVSYSNGMLHALCSSAMLYSWNVEGQLVSKRMVKFQKPASEFGFISGSNESQVFASNESIDNQFALTSSSESISKKNSSKSFASNQDISSSSLSASSAFISSNLLNGRYDFDSIFNGNTKLNQEQFYRIQSLVMPNCQTYAIVIDVYKFLSIYKKYSSFNVHSNPELLLLVLLWKRHVGCDKVHIEFPEKLTTILNNLNLTLAGDNFTVTVPISKKIYQISEPYQKVDDNEIIHFEDFNFNKKISFCFSPLTTSIHVVAASALAQCFISMSNNENLLMLSSLSQTMSTDLLDACKEMIKPSIPALASYFLFQSENLYIILLNYLSFLTSSFDEQMSTNVLFNIEHLFGNWNIILPFVLFHSSRFPTLPKLFSQEVEKHLFPTILQNQEIFVLLKNCFATFSKNINDIDGFFQKLISECIQNNNRIESQLISLAVIRPFEFFNSAIEIQSSKSETTNLILLMVKKMINPDRTILMSMVCHAISMQKNGFFVNIEEIFSTIMKNNLFFSFSKNFAAFGDITGYLHMISMDSGSNVWATKKIKDSQNNNNNNNNDDQNQILFVSFSPSGSRLIFVDSEFDITWMSINLNVKQNSKEKFVIIGSYNMKKKIAASEISWKSEGTVVFLKNQKVIFETSFPKMSFFEKVADKFVSFQ
ncbi:hypothetical protein M9Y10_013344 [Tritrichomonas musculus]|uniref:BEACH domain-containing protein n=1 Tax=Tritrichomonas musculus TaxID=1915356 RepID=A0ABR2I801_9EUKA